jgi:ribosomal protein S18 acetylase RimI-like enzyme
MNFEIRKLGPNDATQYRELRKVALLDVPVLFIESLGEFGQHSLTNLRKQLESDDNFIIGAFDHQNQLVGMIGFRRESSPRLDHIGSIWGLYVASGARGKKLGYGLIARLLTGIRQIQGVEQVKLQLEASNQRARELYESFGFEAWGVEPRAVRIDGIYYDDLHMILKKLHTDEI